MMLGVELGMVRFWRSGKRTGTTRFRLTRSRNRRLKWQLQAQV